MKIDQLKQYPKYALEGALTFLESIEKHKKSKENEMQKNNI